MPSARSFQTSTKGRYETMSKKPLTKEEYPILYAAQQRREAAEKEQQAFEKRELLAWIEGVRPDFYAPLLAIVKELPFVYDEEGSEWHDAL